MEDESGFLIRSPDKIISKLSILLKDKCLLTAYFGENNESFITSVLEVNKKDNVFICDVCKDSLMERFLNSPNILFKTERLGAKVSFDAIKPTKVEYQGGEAFALPIPETIRWVEQREYYRVKAPISPASHCHLILKDQESTTLKLYDISLQGFSVLNASSEISALMTPGVNFEQCKLILDDGDEDTISFEIRSKYIINSNNPNKKEKIGCKFTQITPALENTIHSYMLQIEREILKKRAVYVGLDL